MLRIGAAVCGHTFTNSSSLPLVPLKLSHALAEKIAADIHGHHRPFPHRGNEPILRR